MNVKEIERVVGKIQHHLFKNSNSLSVGAFKSQFKGSGLQFKEHQVYTPGDDVRFIDWKLTAKSSKAFIKTFEEERNIEIICVLDITQSMLLGFNEVSKLQAACEIICLLYLLSKKTKDKVQVVLYHNGQIIELPKKSGKEGMVFLIAHLERLSIIEDDGSFSRDTRNIGVDLENSKKIFNLKSFLARKKEVVYLGDLSSFESKDDLGKLLYRKNFHCFKVNSPVDQAESKKYSMVFKGRGREGQSYFESIFMGKSEKTKTKHTKIKNIDVSTRYLETFIKEMR
jgi:uncharacterized protein (DUF58 family)